jgi:hypothetical protein
MPNVHGVEFNASQSELVKRGYGSTIVPSRLRKKSLLGRSRSLSG